MLDQDHKRLIDQLLGQADSDKWLDLWHAGQGGANWNVKHRRVAQAVPYPRSRSIRVLDLCSGPGDLGRAIRLEYRHAGLDFLDRDYFLLELGKRINEDIGIPARYFRRDCWETAWQRNLDRDYDVIAATTALHWFDVSRLLEIFGQVHELLSEEGIFIFNEPASSVLVPGGRIESSDQQKPQRKPNRYREFWDRVNNQLGFDYDRTYTHQTPNDREIIDDEGIPVTEYIDMLRNGGFTRIDVVETKRFGYACLAAAK